MNQDLKDWLEHNKIVYKEKDKDIIDIEDLGKLYINDLDDAESIFKKNKKTGEIVFNLMTDKKSLEREGIHLSCFKFGDNWYWCDLDTDFKLNILKYVGKRTPLKIEEKLKEYGLELPRYANLGMHSPYELLNGSFSFKDWVLKAKHMSHKCIGICDMNTMAGTLAFQKECTSNNINFVFGYSLEIRSGNVNVPAKVYCETDKGLHNLLRIQKTINVDNEFKYISVNDLKKHGEGNVIVFGVLSSAWLRDNWKVAEDIISSFDDAFYQFDISEYLADRIDKQHLDALEIYWHNKSIDLDPVLICDNYYLDEEDYINKNILNKIATGAAHDQSKDQYFKDLDELYDSLEPLLDMTEKEKLEFFCEICNNTDEIAKRANAKYETSRNFMPQYDMTPEEIKKYGTRHNMFNQIIEEGFKTLVPKGKEEEYRKRVEYEKYVIESTDNIDYFLVQYDTVNWARQNGIMTGIARGSGGGCLLLYLMGITKLDPMKYNLIFERFLLPSRSGLYESDVTMIDGKIDSDNVVEVDFGDRKISFDADDKLIVKRKDSIITIYADELMEGDDILFDNRDKLWTINEL